MIHYYHGKPILLLKGNLVRCLLGSFHGHLQAYEGRLLCLHMILNLSIACSVLAYLSTFHLQLSTSSLF